MDAMTASTAFACERRFRFLSILALIRLPALAIPICLMIPAYSSIGTASAALHSPPPRNRPNALPGDGEASARSAIGGRRSFPPAVGAGRSAPDCAGPSTIRPSPPGAADGGGFDAVPDDAGDVAEQASSVPPAASPNSEAAKAAVDFARLCGRLKSTPRTGWLTRSVPRPESVADHSWRVSALCLLLLRDCGGEHVADSDCRRRLDEGKCLEMAVVHDLAESLVGDIAPSNGVPRAEKRRLEREAMERIAVVLGDAACPSAGRRLLNLFAEYEERETPEATAVKDLDLLDMIVQADEYERAHGPNIDLTEFFAGTPPERFRTDGLKEVAEEVHRQREERLSGNRKGWAVVTGSEENGRASLSEEDMFFIAQFAQGTPGIVKGDVEAVVRALRIDEECR